MVRARGRLHKQISLGGDAVYMTGVPIFRTIREQIGDRIRAHVMSGRLSEGTSLREKALAKEYGVKRLSDLVNTMRERNAL